MNQFCIGLSPDNILLILFTVISNCEKLMSKTALKMDAFTICKILAFSLLCLHEAECHGRLKNPASRSSMWRYGFNNPINYNDNELFCGGRSRQWQTNRGRCGVCGDPYDGERSNEASGKYANGVIAQTYQEGETIPITVEVTANHLGWFEFRLCPVNNKYNKATEQCLNRNVLRDATTGQTRVSIGSQTGDITTYMKLPPGVTCSQCVLQWKYHTGNSWGVDEATGRGCLGCGAEQEEFYACADIAIQNGGGNGYPTVDNNPTQRPTYYDDDDNGPTWREGPKNDDDDSPNGDVTICRSAGAYRGQSSIDQWCEVNCGRGYCPSSHCECVRLGRATPTRGSPSTATPAPLTSSSTRSSGATCHVFVSQDHNPLDGVIFSDIYCQTICTMGECPNFCRCANSGSTRLMNCQARNPRMRSLPNFNEFCSALCSMDICPTDCECI